MLIRFIDRRVERDSGVHRKEELLLADVGRGPHGGLTLRLEGKQVFR